VSGATISSVAALHGEGIRHDLRLMKLFVALTLPFLSLPAQQVADSTFRPPLASPAYGFDTGPLVAIDEAHVNFHKVDGRYAPFASLLRRDGYRVRANTVPFTRAVLDSFRVLVIANALAPQNEGRWVLPNPSAFTGAEIAIVREWVRDGGSLLLIADHMPMAGAAADLAAEFGAMFGNGFAADSAGNTGPYRFRRDDRTLRPHPIFEGRNRSERIDSVTSFTGQAFRLVGAGAPLMVLGKSTLILPVVAWQFPDSIPRMRADGMLQGAALEFGRGRVVLLGEAAMLSAQLGGPQRQPMGMNHPVAAQNPQFVLNVLRWLTRLY
jgi:hypothetical protein